jgi:hypothetical protein
MAAASVSVALLPTALGQTRDANPVQPESPTSPLTAPAERLKLAGVHNAGKISDQLFRGAQPSEQGFSELKKLGVTSIVNLRQRSREVEWERKLAESLGLRFVNNPVRGFAA